MTAPTFRDDVTVELLDHMGTDDKVAIMARGSTGNGDAGHDKNVRLVRSLMAEGHKVPFEHCAMTFRIEAPIFVSRQLVKHRHSSISELSGRYTEMPGVFYVPGEDRPLGQQGKRMAYDMVPLPDQDEAYVRGQIEGTSQHAWSMYESMLRRGVSREVARMVLPTNLYSELRMTVNLLSLMNILQLRVNWDLVGEAPARKPSRPQHEIHLVASEMAMHMQLEFPAVYEAFEDNGYTI